MGSRRRLVVARASDRMDSIGEVRFAGSPCRPHPDVPTPLAGRTHRRLWAAAGGSNQVTRLKSQGTALPVERSHHSIVKSRTHLPDRVVGTGRVYTVAQEDHIDAAIGIDPERRARKARMSKRARRHPSTA